MNELLDEIEDAATPSLTRLHKDGQEITFEVIRDAVKYASLNPAFMAYGKLGEEELETIARRLDHKFDINMTLGATVAEPYTPWLDSAKVDIDPFFWRRYQRYITKGGFPPLVVGKLDQVTDRILGYLENPKKEDKWERKGLVVGHVQSGKTANYTGLICKAADAGYRLIIVMAGIHNNLRNQTQKRIDAGFVGRDSSKIMPSLSPEESLIGVGLIDSEKKPSSLTTSTKDFNKAFAQQQVTGLDEYKEAVVLVIKKNKSTLENLISWLKALNLTKGKDLIDFPMLLIDDEADNASINTNDELREATTINRLIRDLLNSFHRKCYLGYTATPFANIFVDPETDHDMYGGDLFPRDFIISLDAPSNYIGAHRIFTDDADLDILREVDDYEDLLPLKHKKDLRPTELPDSLLEAVRVFILARATRLARGQTKAHNSMLVNVSRFTDVQSHTRGLVHIYLDQLRHGITGHYMLPSGDALGSSEIKALHDTWADEFSNSGHAWEEIQGFLHPAAAPIKVIEVNASRNSEPLNYEEYNDSLNVIAVGGISLSRGLTLEGLTVSYFLRNSVMYDTLMQMGRWFGYRDGYSDICRIYMTDDAISWYQHIADVTEELRDEFVKMDQAGLTPKDFGLAVRSHPDSLIVTARNKMRSGTKVRRSISLAGYLAESTIIRNSRKAVERNMELLKETISSVDSHGEYESAGNHHLWRSVPAEIIKDFINSYDDPYPLTLQTQRAPLLDYIGKLEKRGITNWDVALMSLGATEITSPWAFEGYPVKAQVRSISQTKDRNGNVDAWAIGGAKRRIASTGDEKIGLPEKILKEIEKPYRDMGKNVPDKAYRERRGTPLLMLHLLDLREHKDSAPFKKGVVGYGISFPGGKVDRRERDLVEYIVNTTWYSEHYGDDLDEERADE